MNDILSIPEIVKNILTFAEDNRTHSINARVCKLWSEIALDLLWQDKCRPFDLFSILGPLSVLGPSQRLRLQYNTFPQPQDWNRFLYYSRRVRSIVFRGPEKTNISLGEAAFREIARTRPSSVIFPRLRTLAWMYTDITLAFEALMFMHDKIEQFQWYLPKPHRESINVQIASFFDNIASRMPFLTIFVLCSNAPLRMFEDGLVAVARGLPRLACLRLPMYYLNAAVTEALSQLGSLDYIYYEAITKNPEAKGDPNDVKDFKPVFESDAFPALRTLYIAVHLKDFDQAFHPSVPLSNLVSLRLHEIQHAASGSVYDLLLSLSTASPLLRDLCLDLRASLIILEEDRIEKIETNADRITMETLEPLFNFKHLVKFSISHDFPLEISEDQIEELARRWPTLQSINLNSEPLCPEWTESFGTMSLRTLIPFIRYCPNIGEIGVYVDAFDVPDVSDIPSDQSATLQKLRFGTSPIQDVYSVANFLSRICPVGCVVDTDLKFHELDFEGSFYQQNHALSVTWGEVKRLLSVLITVREEERNKYKDLQLQMEKLRSQVNGTESKLVEAP